jgi:hypothetical protein
VQASFGVAATADLPGVDELTAALARGGYRAVAASAAGPAPDADGELPVDDDSARALAADVKAEAALVVGVAVGAPGPVRGTPLTAAPVRAWLRLVEVGGGPAPVAAAVATAAWGGGALALAARPRPAGARPGLRCGAGAGRRRGPAAGRQRRDRAGGRPRRVARGLVRATSRRRRATSVGVAGVGADGGAGVDSLPSTRPHIAKATPGFSARTKVVDGVVVVQVKAVGAP